MSHPKSGGSQSAQPSFCCFRKYTPPTRWTGCVLGISRLLLPLLVVVVCVLVSFGDVLSWFGCHYCCFCPFVVAVVGALSCLWLFWVGDCDVVNVDTCMLFSCLAFF